MQGFSSLFLQKICETNIKFDELVIMWTSQVSRNFILISQILLLFSYSHRTFRVCVCALILLLIYFRRHNIILQIHRYSVLSSSSSSPSFASGIDLLVYYEETEFWRRCRITVKYYQLKMNFSAAWTTISINAMPWGLCAFSVFTYLMCVCVCVAWRCQNSN